VQCCCEAATEIMALRPDALTLTLSHGRGDKGRVQCCCEAATEIMALRPDALTLNLSYGRGDQGGGLHLDFDIAFRPATAGQNFTFVDKGQRFGQPVYLTGD